VSPTICEYLHNQLRRICIFARKSVKVNEFRLLERHDGAATANATSQERTIPAHVLTGLQFLIEMKNISDLERKRKRNAKIMSSNHFVKTNDFASFKTKMRLDRCRIDEKAEKAQLFQCITTVKNWLRIQIECCSNQNMIGRTTEIDLLCGTIRSALSQV